MAHAMRLSGVSISGRCGRFRLGQFEVGPVIRIMIVVMVIRNLCMRVRRAIQMGHASTHRPVRQREQKDEQS